MGECSKLEAQLAEAEADSERLDWLEELQRQGAEDGYIWEMFRWDGRFMRQAIDAATQNDERTGMTNTRNLSEEDVYNLKQREITYFDNLAVEAWDFVTGDTLKGNVIGISFSAGEYIDFKIKTKEGRIFPASIYHLRRVIG